MSGFYGGTLVDDPNVRALGVDAYPAATGEVHGSVFDQALHDNPIAGAYRLARDQMERNVLPNLAREGLVPRDWVSPMMTADEANERYPIPGKKLFTSSVPESIAQSVYDAQAERIARQRVIDRRAGGIATGMVAQFGTQIAASALDPLNIAASLIPVAPAAKMAAILARQGSAAGRSGVRAAAGAGQGALGAAVLEPIVAAATLQESNDYTMASAALNLATGAALGGLINPLVGRFSAAEREFRRPRVSPEAHQAALGDALVAQVEGRPTVAAEIAEAVEAAQARQELAAWARQVDRLAGQTDDAILRATPEIPAEWQSVVTRSRENLARLREEADRLRAEIGDASDRTVRRSLDPATADRLEAIEAEMAGAIPRARRAALVQERTMLLEGRGDADIRGVASDELEVARGIAEQRGLRAELARAEERLRRAETDTEQTEMAARMADRLRTENETAASRLWDVEEAKIAARAEMIQDLAARTIRRYAAGQGAALTPDEIARMAVQAVTGGDDAIRSILARIDDQAGVPYAVIDGPTSRFADADARLDAMASDAETRALAIAQEVNPDAVKFEAEAARLDADAPKASGPVSEQLAELEKSITDLNTIIQAERSAGRLGADDDAALRLADDQMKLAESDAKAMEAAGFCLAVRA